MRVLIGAAPGGEVDDARLEELYAVPATPWVRVNMVSTVDGSATGEGGLTGSINNEADHRVFDLLRRQADVIVVGAGTARAEGYTALDLPLVLVSRRGEVPPRLRGAEPGRVLMATCEHAEHLAEARARLGEEHVLVLGSHRVDLPLLRQVLVDRGWPDPLRGRPAPAARPGRRGGRRRDLLHHRAAAGRRRAPPDHRRPTRRRTAGAAHPPRAGRHPPRPLVPPPRRLSWARRGVELGLPGR